MIYKTFVRSRVVPPSASSKHGWWCLKGLLVDLFRKAYKTSERARGHENKMLYPSVSNASFGSTEWRTSLTHASGTWRPEQMRHRA
jgi:hypothetical protein